MPRKSPAAKAKADKERMRMRREDQNFREDENLRRAEAHRIERGDEELRSEENARRAQRLRNERQDEESRDNDNLRRAEAHRIERHDELLRTEDNRRRAEVHRIEREDKELRSEENRRRAERHRIEREDEELRSEENKSRAERHRIEREDEELRSEENKSRAERHRIEREEESSRQNENLRRAESHRRERENEECRMQENTRRAETKRKERQDEGSRDNDNLRRAEAHRRERQDEVLRLDDNRRRAEEHRIQRENEQFRSPERVLDATRRASSRTNPVKRRLDYDINATSKQKRRCQETSSYEHLYNKYQVAIKAGPTFVCSSCGSCLYETSTTKTSREKLLASGKTDEFISKILFVDQQQHRLCSTCTTYIKKDRVPRWSLSNGLHFPEIPPALVKLNRLEERLVSPRIPFMQIRLKGYEQQWALKGNVVNVENNLDQCIRALPRQFNDTSIIQLQLKRRLCYRGYYIYDKLCPSKVVNALACLIRTPVYIRNNIVMEENWNQFSSDSVNFVVDPGDNLETEDNANTVEEQDEEDEMTGADETLLYHQTELESIVTSIAPAEGNIPIALNRDLDAEALSFPTIYCGQERIYNPDAKLTYTDIAKSELRRYDRRCAKPEKILYMFKKSFNEKVYSAYHICLRQKKKDHDGQPLTAGRLRESSTIATLIAKDDGYAVFKNIRSSPAYWKEQEKRVVAMIRQLGGCTFFITLSAAETKWTELLVILTKLLENKIITDEEAEALEYVHRASLVRQDPATCMTHFNHKFKEILNTLLKKANGVFAPHAVEHHYSRVEFQMRGSPHSHGLYWLPHAPIYDQDSPTSEKTCVEFIDKHITCQRDDEGEMESLIGYQIHKHSHTCRKGGQTNSKCRFGFPRPPMSETRILHPLPKNFDKPILKQVVAAHQKIQRKLSGWGQQFKENIPFETFLESLQMDEELYILALRYSIDRSTVFLRRATSEIFINNYNKKILQAWRANMDIQFVLDAYACAKYCASYISKAEGGVSKLLRAATKDVRNGNFGIQDKLKNFAKILINGSEISAQEAAAFLLSIPNTYSSCVDVFINTAPPSERIGILKAKNELDKLSDESQDICEKGLIDHYTQRPVELESTCLAEFASMYTFRKTKTKDGANSSQSDSDDSPANLKLLDGSGVLVRRRVRRIIRFRHFNRSDEKNYWREQLMLFVPWRNEETDLLSVNHLNVAKQKISSIEENSKPFYNNKSIDDENLRNLINDCVQQGEEEDGENIDVQNHLEIVEQEQYADNFLTGRSTKTNSIATMLAPRLVPDEEYFNLMRSLNVKQRKIVMDIIYKLKATADPFYIFLTGGAGVGKSHVITSIVQSYIRFCNKLTSIPPDDMTILVCAPTGKAAFNVFGVTLHCAFKLPPTQHGGNIGKLDPGTANSLRLKYSNTKIFIIDEISMVSSKMFGWIDQRLRELFNPLLPFGGKSLLVVGHLRQLPPIPGGKSAFIFKPPRSAVCSTLVSRNPLWEIFQFYELDQIMRQRGDELFCKALNNMAESIMDENDVNLLQSREVSSELQPPKEAIWLFQTNKECQERNRIVHASLGTEGVTSIAYDIVKGHASKEMREKLKEDAKQFTTQESDGIPYETHLQLGAIYFVTTNIDVSDGLFNGATGHLQQIDYRLTVDNIRLPNTAWMLFENQLIGSSLRANCRAHGRFNNVNTHWTPIDRVTRTLSKSYKYPGAELVRTQIPLLAANAMTIAKSQGSSMPCIVVSTTRKLSRENLYVACSRATSLKGLFISGKFLAPESLNKNDDVSQELELLRRTPLLFSLKYFADISSPNKLYFHNVTSFKKYRSDIIADPNVMSSSMIAVIEPHITKHDDVTLPGYICSSRKDSKGSFNYTNSEGYLFFNKEGYPIEVLGEVSKTLSRTHFQILTIRADAVNILICYRHPNYPIVSFLADLRTTISATEGNIILIGDLNVDIISDRQLTLPKFFNPLNFKSLLGRADVTTEYGTQIDVCFSNFNTANASVAETYYSYHKGICVYWDV